MNKIKTFLEKSEQYAVFLICGIMAFIMGFNLTESLFNTTKIQYDPGFLEYVSYHHDNLFINIIYVVCIFLILTLVIPYLEKIPGKIQTAILVLFVIVFGSVYIFSAQCIPASDSMKVTNAAVMAANGDYSFMSDRYFSNCNYQLGFVFFCELFFDIFGKNPDTFISLQIFNVVLVALSYVGILLTVKTLYPGKRIFTTAVLTLFFCVQPLFFSVFTYGVIPGLTCIVYAFFFEIKLFEENDKKKSVLKRIIFAALSCIFISIACMVKLNYLIALIAMLICAFIKMISKKKFAALAYIVVTALCALNITNLVVKNYESRSNIKLDDGVPFVAYLDMGMNYPNELFCCCNAAGWFDPDYIEYNHAKNNFISEKTAEASKKSIKKRLSFFINDTSAANDFYFEKITSQWNEPTYACIWLSQIREKYSYPKEPALSLAYNKQNQTEQFMNIYQLMIYLGTFTGIILCFRKKDIFSVLYLLTALGGFLFHLLFEAKSQYILPYFVILTGFSAVGTEYLCRKTALVLSRKVKIKIHIFENKQTNNTVSEDDNNDDKNKIAI